MSFDFSFVALTSQPIQRDISKRPKFCIQPLKLKLSNLNLQKKQLFRGASVENAKDESAGELLAEQVIKLMQRLKMPNGLSEVGFSDSHIESLVTGTLPQHRVTRLSPRPAGSDELQALFRSGMKLW